MLTMLTAPGLTLLFLGVVVGLGIAFVWMLWGIEQMSKPHRNAIASDRSTGIFGRAEDGRSRAVVGPRAIGEMMPVSPALCFS